MTDNTDYTNPPEKTSVADQSTSLFGSVTSKVFTTAVFGASASLVVALGTLSAVVLKKTTVLTYQNFAHTLLTKGRVWLPSKYRNFSSSVE